MREIFFDGIPFSVEEKKVMDCQYGEHYYNTSTNKPKTEQGFNTSTNPKPKRLWPFGLRVGLGLGDYLVTLDDVPKQQVHL